MTRILKFAIGIAAIAFCLVGLSVVMFPRSFTAIGIPGLAMMVLVGLGAFIFVGLVYVYSFKSKR